MVLYLITPQFGPQFGTKLLSNFGPTYNYVKILGGTRLFLVSYGPEYIEHYSMKIPAKMDR